MLRSVSGMRGFTIHATDGDMGSVDEFLFDDEQWTIRYLVVNTGGWLSGRLVLVSPIAFRSVDWDRETFDVALTRQQVEQSPSIATDQPVSRQQEEEYSRYYGYPYYWDGLGLWAPACTRGCPPSRTPPMGMGNGDRATAHGRPPPAQRTRGDRLHDPGARRRSWPCRRFHRGRRELGDSLSGRGYAQLVAR